MSHATFYAASRSAAGRLACGLLTGGGAVILVAACTTPAAAPGKDADFARIEHTCSSCHGVDGVSTSPNFPKLAGQPKEYLLAQLLTFQDKTRADPKADVYMWGMAAGLSTVNAERLAADYAAMPAGPRTPIDADDPKSGKAYEAGKAIFAGGIAQTGVPACRTCHGDQAQGDKTRPRLAGQHEAYLERQLHYFAANSRDNKTMHQNAQNLTEPQIGELALYLSAQ